MANKLNKLELTWIGKEDDQAPLEPRIFLDSPQNSYGEVETGTLPNGKPWPGNMLIHGDNLLALKALEQDFAGQVKCIYIDPPYNVDATNEYYDDLVEHSVWLSLICPRLQILRNLLTTDGVIFIQISDEEQAYLKVLCDEVFGRKNFVNMVSVNMKNIAGASGGGEDKRLKKNCEYILIYAKNYESMGLFNGPYSYTEMSELIQQYKDEGRSWKYTTVLLDPGEKEYFGSTVDGDGNEIKVYIRRNPVMMSINQIAKRDGISEKEAYKRYGISIFRTTNAQSSIRTRILDYRKDEGITEDLLSIEYIPKTGKNRGKLYEQFYKGDKGNLFVWLRDTSEVIDGELFKKDLQGTYWDMNAWMKNLTKEGDVEFPQGKKPEKLISQIISMTTSEGDLVLDSFLGSGTTAATAHKMCRRWIGIELGDHAFSHCVPRLTKVIQGKDNGGITSDVNWKGGGGFKFYELAPSLLNHDKHGNLVINKEYNADMLAAAMAKHQGFTYSPDEALYWKQGRSSEHDFIFTTTQLLTSETLETIHEQMGENESLLICCTKFQPECRNRYSNITIKKIPKVLLDTCEFDKDDYSLNIVSVPDIEDEEWDDFNPEVENDETAEFSSNEQITPSLFD
ncbi:MAG: site-specific DNA-methyltransferase [Alistipes timonensis]|nr:site-specific DNA-methyltransferase [Alistipes timonensis]